ncbi:MAG TPA: WYL domain-containing protein [Terracidiphilus sp.]|nr:WYL domain-containing protein [Terracidiphilus sp.]
MKADRLLSVLLLLQSKGRATERELAERLEVSQRTIHRDLEALSAARVPVVAMRGAQGGWELDKGWRTQVPGLDEAELRALLMAQPRVVGHPRLAAAAESALNKLMAALPGPMRAQAETMRERLHVDATGWYESGEDLSMLAVVQEAVAQEHRLAFDYTRADRQKSSRTVDPLGLVAKGLSWYLVARTANGMRTFKVSRMERVTALAVGFERPAHFDLAAYWKQSTAELDRQRKSYVAILCLSVEAGRKLEGWCPTTPVESAGGSLPEGWLTLRAEFDAEWQAKFVVLGLGSQVAVISPRTLQQAVSDEVRLMARASLHSPKRIRAGKA